MSACSSFRFLLRMAGTERVLLPPTLLLDDEAVEPADEVAVEGVEDEAEAETRMPIWAADARCGAAIVRRAAGRRRRHHRRGEGAAGRERMVLKFINANIEGPVWNISIRAFGSKLWQKARTQNAKCPNYIISKQVYVHPYSYTNPGSCSSFSAMVS